MVFLGHMDLVYINCPYLNLLSLDIVTFIRVTVMMTRCLLRKLSNSEMLLGIEKAKCGELWKSALATETQLKTDRDLEL